MAYLLIPAQAVLMSIMLEISYPDFILLSSHTLIFWEKVTCILFNMKFSGLLFSSLLSDNNEL